MPDDSFNEKYDRRNSYTHPYHSLTFLLFHSFTSFTHSFTHSLIHTLTQPHTHAVKAVGVLVEVMVGHDVRVWELMHRMYVAKLSYGFMHVGISISISV